MALLEQFSDRYHRNTLSLFVLFSALAGMAAILFLSIPTLTRHVANRYSIGFADAYYLIAENLADGQGYRWRIDMPATMTREPGYPLLLAAAFKLVGPTVQAALSLNFLLTVGIVVMLAALANRLTSDPRAPAIAIILFLLYPGTLISEARGGVEILFVFVGFAFLLALSWAVEIGGLWRYLVAGLAFGAVVEVRSTPITFPALLLVYALFTATGVHRRLKAASRIIALVAGMGLVMLPWLVRNYRLVHAFVPFPTIQGLASQEGLCICREVSLGVDDLPVIRAAGRRRADIARQLGMRFEGVDYFQMFYDAHDELAFNNMLTGEARNEYARHPGFLLGCFAKNLFFNLWFLGKTWSVTKLNMFVQLPALAIVFYGLWIVWRRGELCKMDILLLYAVSIAITHSLVIAEARYSIPVFALLTIPASVGVTSIWDALRRAGGLCANEGPCSEEFAIYPETKRERSRMI